jgi:acetoin:2,6-dichlorophenolindophenol oxidoreductase subunit alpha
MSTKPGDLKQAFRRMSAIRAFEEAVTKEFAAGNIPGFLHVYLGQEASAVGVCIDLSDKDWIGSTHRGHGHCIAKGCDLTGMMLEIMGRKGGLCGGKGGSMHIADMSKGMLGANAIVGGSPPIAVGAALTQKTKSLPHVAVAFIGDGASNQGTTFEAMNLAVVLKVPAIFVFENNGYGEFTNERYSVGASSIADRTRAFGMPVESIDGCDFFAVREGMGKACAHARSGKGPYALELKTSRYLGHFVGDPQHYRSAEELSKARENDPLVRFRARVSAEGLLSKEELDAIEAEVRGELETAVKFSLAAPVPALSALTTDVYVSY